MRDDIRPADRPGSQNPDTSYVAPVQQQAPPAEPQHKQPIDDKHLLGPPKKGWRRFREWYHFLSKKQKAIFWGLIAGLFISSGLIWALFFRPDPPPPPPAPVAKKVEPPKPTTEPTCVSGVQVPIGKKPKQVTGIMVENSPSARPQSGLYNAEVVYEAIAEGGITRFLLVFEKEKPGYVGPVRSLRPYYIDFIAPYDAGIAHAGGSGQALAEVKNFKDLEAFHHPGIFFRIPSRYAPHNLYTNRAQLAQLQKKNGWKSKKCKGFARLEKEVKPTNAITAKSIDFNISSANYNAHFDYDRKSNTYVRSMGGVPHVDERANKVIRKKVVIALVMKHHYAGIYSVYGTKGKGAAYVFQNGKIIKGTWSKKNRRAQFKFLDKNNKVIKLVPGRTWVSIVRNRSDVAFKPAPKPKPRPQPNTTNQNRQ